MSEVVNHPKHYNRGKIEVIEFIEDQGLGFSLGNTVKYICRAGVKDPTKEIEDLCKAQWYLSREIEVRKASREGREPLRPNDMNPRATSPNPSSATTASTSDQDEPQADTASNARIEWSVADEVAAVKKEVGYK